MKLTNKTFTIIEVVILFALGTLGRRLLETGLTAVDFPDLLNSVIRILFVILIIVLAILAHNRISRYLVEKGWLDEEVKR
ncbi:MAG: hypothetical protein IH586_07195 [Anaerolineaceae bacterium]|nr:hypothetical protein [Anaerolineaceae bacterium]